ncbi:MAG: elongation factor G [Planctomycetota bacterium]|nr:MAG: elongation factor G [Planctomycetota bacterium]
MPHRTPDIRNFALVGHGSAGKTATLDALAYVAKVSPRHGSTDDGSSVSDTEPEEQERHQTLTSHIFHFPWQGKYLQFIDTPGHPDFIADAIGAFRAAETVIFTIDCPSGPTFNTRRLWSEADRVKAGRMLLLTKADAENLDLDEILSTIQGTFGDRVVPITLPSSTGAGFDKVLNAMSGDLAEHRETLVERVAESDDELMERFFENGELSDEELATALPAAIASGTVIPLFTICPTSEKGLGEFMDFCASYGPSPMDFHNRFASANPDADEESDDFNIEVEPDSSGDFLGLVFKLVSDPFVGKMSYIRVLRGELCPEEGFTLARTGSHEKLGGLLEVQGKDTGNLDKAVPGTICAVAKVESLQIGDTVCKDGSILHLRPFHYPSSMVAVAVTPKSRQDEQKIGPSLDKLVAEDPTFHVLRDPATGELVVEGLSQMHLDVMFSRLKRRYKVEVETHVPTVPYRETCIAGSDGHHRHKKQSGGKGQFGEVYCRIRPRGRGEGYQFTDKIVGGSIPRQFIPEVDKGVQSVMAKGVIAGFPVVDVEVELYDGKFHDVDSDQLSFQLAGGRAFADAFEKAKPVLLEPIMDLEVHVPSRFTGDISSNLSTHRARMSGIDQDGDDQVIRCTMPLKEARSYQSQLRSITAGEGTFTMKFSHYDPLPANLQQEIVAQRKQENE